jgi:hypothetical protein
MMMTTELDRYEERYMGSDQITLRFVPFDDVWKWSDEPATNWWRQDRAGQLIVAYHGEKSIEPKKMTRQMPFDIPFGYKFSAATHDWIRFENGVESDMTSEEVQELNLKKLVDFLEHLVPATTEKKA